MARKQSSPLSYGVPEVMVSLKLWWKLTPWYLAEVLVVEVFMMEVFMVEGQWHG
jgi:hypothetical protein